jgi:hypothetical protein
MLLLRVNHQPQDKIMPEKKLKKSGTLGSKSDKEAKMSLGAKTDKEVELTKNDKESEIDRLLSEEEELEKNYKRIEKQGMSDQGIVSPEELVEFGKDVYKGAKKGVKKVVGKVKEVVEKAKEKLK